MPITAELGEKWGLVNHIVDDSQVLTKAIEVAEAITRNNRNLVVLYKSVINDGLQLDMEHARVLEKVRTYTLVEHNTYMQFRVTSLQLTLFVYFLYGA
jgi:enoyl-CoA hydratase/carnithine racemase